MFAISASVALPVISVYSSLLTPSFDIMSHLWQTVLPGYLTNTLWLALGTALGVLLLGVPTAWLNSMCQFPGRAWFEWLLLLPLAMPAYIIAYTYTHLLDIPGPIQTLLRDWTGWALGDYWFPAIRSTEGAIIMFSLVLYPYVYLLARAAFLDQSICALEVSRSLGCNRWQSFRRVALPLARPAIVAGLSLALMEVLADFGTVQYFGVATFTTGIYRTWFGLGDSVAAAQLASMLMSLVFMLIVLERWGRSRARYQHATTRIQRLPRYQLGTGWAVVAVLTCSLPVLLGFALPLGQLVWWSLDQLPILASAEFLQLAGHSFLLAVLAAFCALVPALLLAYGRRLRPSRIERVTSRLATMGYAVPGMVIAIGVLLPFGWMDRQMNQWIWPENWGRWGLLLSGTLFTLLYAYNVRFLAVSLQTVEAGLGKVRTSVDDAGRSLGLSTLGVLLRLHAPLIRGSVLTAMLMVFVDVLKELPATLILRPFNFNTLAVRAYELASDERLADVGMPALMIVLTGLVPVVLISRSISHSRAGFRHE
jgi:iron(III) transport system permease protein